MNGQLSMTPATQALMPDPNRVLLIDMDGVLADFELGFRKEWQKRYPDRPQLDNALRNCFRIHMAFDPVYREDIFDIYRAKGFYQNLEVIPGSLEAMSEIVELGWDPFLCTSPFTTSAYCMSEKQAWVREHLGQEWVRRIIISSEKNLVRGRLLIDDNPELIDVTDAEWKFVIFDQPYKRWLQYEPRMSWENWRDIIGTPTENFR